MRHSWIYDKLRWLGAFMRNVEYFSLIIHLNKINKGQGTKATKIIMFKHPEILSKCPGYVVGKCHKSLFTVLSR